MQSADTEIVFHSQKGVIPFLVTLVGLGWAGYFGCVMVYLLQGLWPTVVEYIQANQWNGLLYLTIVLGFFGIFSLFGLGLASMFPAIALTDRGLKLRHPLRFTWTIPWEKIEGVVDKTKVRGWAAIVIARGPLGVLFPGRFYFNYLFGLFEVGMKMRPVILLAGNLASNQALLVEIQQRATGSRKR